MSTTTITSPLERLAELYNFPDGYFSRADPFEVTKGHNSPFEARNNREKPQSIYNSFFVEEPEEIEDLGTQPQTVYKNYPPPLTSHFSFDSVGSTDSDDSMLGDGYLSDEESICSAMFYADYYLGKEDEWYENTGSRPTSEDVEFNTTPNLDAQTYRLLMMRHFEKKLGEVKGRAKSQYKKTTSERVKNREH